MNSRKKNRYRLRIPKDIILIFCKKKNILTANGTLGKKSMKLKLKIAIDSQGKYVSVSPLPLFKASNAEKKKINSLQKTTMSQIKYLFIESSALIYQKLKLVGVGFRADFTESFLKKNVLLFKLGLSHLTYVKIPEDLFIKKLNKTSFCVYGNGYEKVCKFSATLRSQKRPEPYKGKGILYENEVVILKEGKKL